MKQVVRLARLGLIVGLFVAPLAQGFEKQSSVTVTLRQDVKLPLLVISTANSSRERHVCEAAFLLVSQNDPSRRRYWAPVDLVRSKRSTVNQHARFNINGLETKTFLIALAELRWAKEIAAVWPDSRLEALHEQGAFDLTLQVTCGDQTKTSNAVILSLGPNGSYSLSH